MLKLNLDIQKVPVLIGEVEHVINEMVQSERDSYTETLEPRLLRNDKTDVVGFKNQIGMKSDLLSKCLRQTDTNTLVPAATINGWRSKVVDELFKVAQEINGLGMPKEKAAEPKNESTA